MSVTRQEQTQSIRFLNLGEIVTPNQMNGVNAMAAITNSGTNPVLAAIGKLQNEIDQFKLGALNETEFDNLFVATLNTTTGVKITVEQFNAAWSKMNPVFDAFKDNLKAAGQYNAAPNQKLILVSFTNPKDMRQLQAELEKNNVAFKAGVAVNGQTYLKSIDGIELLLSYVEMQPKDILVQQARERFLQNPTTGLAYDVKLIQGKEKIVPANMEVLDWDRASCKSLEAFLSGTPDAAKTNTLNQ